MKIQKHIRVLVVSAALSGLLACATARVVSVSPGRGGEVAVIPNSAEARQKAEIFMAENCGTKKFEIEREGEEVVGQQTYTTGEAQPDQFNGTYQTNATSYTTNKTEWRIHYICK